MDLHILELAYSTGQTLFFGFMGVVGLGFLIGFHELGHFTFCKLFNIATPSFSIGFGPRLISKKIGQTEFSFSLIPFGGYVEIAGAAEVGQGDQEHAHSKSSDSFAVKPFWQKLLVMLGGIIYNLAFAYAAFTLLFMLGTPKTPLLYKATAKPIIAQVIEGSAAQNAGLMPLDRIIEADGVIITDSIEPLLETIEKKPAQNITLTIDRNGNRETIIVTPDSNQSFGQTVGTLGVVFDMPETAEAHSFISSFWRGVTETNRWIKSTAGSFLHLFRRRSVDQMAGPLMIVAMTMKSAAQGFKIYLLFLAVISINLAILNLIPLPILDGGQILFYSIEAIIGRPLPVRVREYIHIATWLGFIALFLYLSCVDVSRIFQPTIVAIRSYLGV